MHSKSVEANKVSVRAKFRGISCVIAIGLVSLLASCSSERASLDVVSAAPYQAPKEGAVQGVAAAEAREKRAKIASVKRVEYVSGLKGQTRLIAYGRGPYICSPSGFGRTSRCVPRWSFY